MPLATTESLRADFEAQLMSRHGANLRDLYEAWFGRIGANGIVATLAKLEPGCHDRGHDLGKAIYARIGEISRALATCEGACNSGCMHGVFRQALAGDGASAGTDVQPRAVAVRVEKACLQGGGYPIGDCIHGMGHAFMYLAAYDIPKAMAYCDQLADYKKAYYCATGAYMEFSNNPPEGFLLAKSIYYPCNESPYPAACFRYRFPVGLPGFYRAGGTLRQLVRGCIALEGQFRLGCFHGIGNGHLALLAPNPDRLAEICRAGEREDQTVCVEGAIERMSRYYPDAAAQACRSLRDWRRPVCETARVHSLYFMERSFAFYGR